MNYTKLTLGVMLFMVMGRLKAQDPVFSQPFLAPLYLNPAATGAGENDLRFSLLHRRQWLTIPSQFNYTSFSVDKFFPSIKGGLGFMATSFSEGYLKRTGVYGSYAYTICSGEPNIARNDELQTWFVSGGIQLGLAQRRIDYSKLTFADQLNQDGIIPGGVSAADPPVFNKKWYPDFSGGLYLSHAVAGKGNLLLGASARHVNRPDETLTSTSDSFRSPLPVLWGVNAAYQYDGDEWNYGIAVMGYQQGMYRTLQVGLDVKPSSYDFSVGIWGHVGNTIRSFNAVSLNVTYTFKSSSPHRQKFAIGLDQDFPIGGSGLSYTTGSTELGLIWDYDTQDGEPSDNRCKPRVNTSACPVSL